MLTKERPKGDMLTKEQPKEDEEGTIYNYLDIEITLRIETDSEQMGTRN
jgi:hypothetical protein